MADVLELGFIIKGYPGSGRKTEAEVDLATCYQADLVQGAFMGDMIMRVGEYDFSTQFGWMALISWILRLNGIIRTLKSSDTHVVRFDESDDFMSFRSYGYAIFIACSY
jgi:hypothetical protein